MSLFVQYHNVDREGLPLTLPPFAQTQLSIRTSRPNVLDARGQIFMIAGVGKPRRYYLWETFEIERAVPIDGGSFRASGPGWQLG